MEEMDRPSKSYSRRRFLGMGAAAAGLALAAACDYDDPDEPAAVPTAETPPPAEPSPTGSPEASVTLDEKIAQMVMVGFRGQTLAKTEPLYTRLKVGLAGNIVLFDYDVPSEGSYGRNIGSPAQLQALDEQLQALSPHRLLIATDQEGGPYVNRLSPKHGFPASYSAEALGKRDDPEYTRQAAQTMALTMAKAGVNLNLAPVVDLNVNPDNPIIGSIERSFSADPAVVTRNAIAFIQGHHDAGVLTTLKHFPGHGSSKDDSHLGFVDVTGLWSRKELEPFRNVIQAGVTDAIMTAHIFNKDLDPEVPATLSKPVITGILRGELGYNGVVITDDMQMGAIRQYYGFDQAIEMAVNAGADIIALSNNGEQYQPNLAEDGFMAIRRAVTAGRINEARIHESYDRIIELKGRLG
jgi:beta-N-acetylhexosaminidase